MFGPEMDEVDRAFVDSLVPDDAIMPELLAIVTWMDPDGEQKVRYYNQTNQKVSGVLGYLELAKDHYLQQNRPNQPEEG